VQELLGVEGVAVHLMSIGWTRAVPLVVGASWTAADQITLRIKIQVRVERVIEQVSDIVAIQDGKCRRNGFERL